MIGHALRAAVAVAALTALVAAVAQQSEAPTGFDDLSNGLVDDSTHHADQDAFDDVESVADGLGPLYSAGTAINGGTFTIPPALGARAFHPFGDFLLHNVGTGDGIVMAMPEHDAIIRHAGEASAVTLRFRRLSARQQQAIITFLRSL